MYIFRLSKSNNIQIRNVEKIKESFRIKNMSRFLTLFQNLLHENQIKLNLNF